MFGNNKGLEQKLSERGGTVAWATVVDAMTRWTSGSNYENGPHTVGDHKHMKVTLRVEPEGQPPFEATFHQVFVGRAPIKGFQAKVIYDAEDPSKIVIQEGQIFPPGISHEQAEQSAERRKQATAAAESGNIAEFIQEDIRARKAEAALRVQEAQAAYSGNVAQFIETMKAKGAGAGLTTDDASGVFGGSTAKRDIADELTKLADLRDRGALTEAEFDAQKAKLLADN